MKLPITLFSLLTAVVLSMQSCSKKDKNTLDDIPATVQSEINVERCSICPYYIQAVRFGVARYYMVVPKASPTGYICDWFAPYVFFDNKGEVVYPTSELYSNLVAHGVKGKIIFDCP